MNQKLVNSIIFDDCVNILPQIENNSIDLILTDPPYNVLNKNLVNFESSSIFIDLEDHFHRILKKNGILLTFSSWQLWFSLINKWAKIKFWYEIIIHRSNSFAGPYSKRPVNAHEYLLVFCNNQKESYFDIREMGEYKNPYIRGFNNMNSKAHNFEEKREQIYSESLDGFRKPTSVLTMRTKNHFKFNERTEHPTQKDPILIEKLVRSYCPENGVVLDPFAGVGTTALACEKSNRNHISIELEQKWVDAYFNLKEGQKQ